MTVCKNCGQEIDENSLACIYGEFSNFRYIKASIPSKFFSFLLPLLGFFLYFLYKPYNRYAASSIFNWTICGFIIWIIIYVAALFLGIIFCL